MRRIVALPAAGALLALLADRLLPLPADDGLRGTLVWLPLSIALLLTVERLTGRRLPVAVRRAEAATLAALVLLGLTRNHLGLRYSAVLVDGVLFTGLCLLLGLHVARLVPLLRRLLGRALPARPSVAFFLLPLAVYLAVLPWATHHRQPDGDEPYYLLLTRSLAYDFDADLTNDYAQQTYHEFVDRELEPQPGDPVGPRGQVYSRHNVLLPLCLVPAYRLFGPFGALVTVALLAAALAWSFLRLASHYWPAQPAAALLVYLLLAFSAPVLLYSHQVWVEVPGALLTVLALDAAYRLGPGADRRRWLALALPLLALPLLKLRFLLVSLPLVLLALWRAAPRARRSLLAAAAALLLLAVAVLTANELIFGNPLKYHTASQLAPYLRGAGGYLRGATGLFFDCAFGLFAAAPLWLLLLPAACRRRTLASPLAFDSALLILPTLLALAPRGEWYGAWCPPFRYGVALLPVLALWLVPLLADRRRAGARLLLGALAISTVALSLVWLTIPGWTYNLATGRSDLLDFLSGRLGVDLARFFPSYARPRLASKVWPPAAFLAMAILWYRPRRRLAAAGSWAVTLWLTGGAALLLLAGRLPTRRVELEAPPVVHPDGQVFPDPWVIGRLRFYESWSLPLGGRIEVPVVPDGSRVSLRLRARALDTDLHPAILTLSAGGSTLGRVVLLQAARSGRRTGAPPWEVVELDPVRWPPEARRLEIRLEGDPVFPHPAGVLLDRLILDWD